MTTHLNKIVLNFSEDEALVLFEFVSRWEDTKLKSLEVIDKAETIVFLDLLSKLETLNIIVDLLKNKNNLRKASNHIKKFLN